MPDIVVMFFLLGLVAGVLKSDLRIPKAAYDILSLLLMLTIGLKGGMALYGTIEWSLVIELMAVAALGAIITLILIPLLLKVTKTSKENAASLAAHYGSVSAGTFAVALAYADTVGLPIEPQVTLYLVMLELPAILVALALYRRLNKGAESVGNHSQLWHETFTNRGVVLLTGGVIIGFMYGPVEGAAVTELLTGAFKAVLALFLLEMGLTAAETLSPIPWKKWKLLLFAIIAPPILSLVGMSAGIALGLTAGSVLILATLTASASYIAAPAAIRTAIPKADIGLAMLLSLGITFPFNTIIGIPLYHQIITSVYG
ncbi:sodium-dependent bicarbonate transport family permease [Alkalimarinus coralli]|uniref:sodium-dependent bicarbonate transport family permease n=1 Tax=Alkalimarinus coralli TaxID=2935863 RepID=UPI00202B5962|nr:sodium-dependent bicarbonate transport family permease [Alkalimarinus coralli]